MALTDKILLIIKFLRLSSKVTFRALTRIFSFFTSGIYSYGLMFFYIIWRNRDRTFEQVIERLAEHDVLVSEGLAVVLGGATGLEFGEAVFQIVNSAIFILWYLRTGAFAVKLMFGDNIPPLYRWLISVSFYSVSVFVIAGRFPTALIELALNFEHVVDIDRLNPLTASQELNRSSSIKNFSSSFL